MCAKIATLFNDLAFLGCDDVTKLNQRPKTLPGVTQKSQTLRNYVIMPLANYARVASSSKEIANIDDI